MRAEAVIARLFPRYAVDTTSQRWLSIRAVIGVAGLVSRSRYRCLSRLKGREAVIGTTWSQKAVFAFVIVKHFMPKVAVTELGHWPKSLER